MNFCTLCQTEVTLNPLTRDGALFCCAGCEAVYSILSAKKELHNFDEHPLFQQAIRSGLISNPLLIKKLSQRNPLEQNELRKFTFEISNLWCPACSELIKLVLLQQKGIQNCVVDYSTDLAAVEYAPRYIDKDQIFSLIAQFGYKPSLLEHSKRKIDPFLSLRFLTAAFCSLNIMMFSYPIYAAYFHQDDEGYGYFFAVLSFFWTLPVITYSAWPIFKRFFSSLRVGILGMETLVVMGVSAAFLLSIFELYHKSIHVYFDSLSVIITLVLLGKIIENKAKFSSKETLLNLARSMPKRARKISENGLFEFIPIKDLTREDSVAIFSGEKIVLDGLVISGQGMCDESLITGEPIPILKEKGSKVLGGSLLINGNITIKSSGTIEESTLHTIVNMVQEKIIQKSIIYRLIDKFVSWFVPFILSIALITGVYLLLFENGTTETIILRAISILLISCPCAIGIAIPLSEAYLMKGIANLGGIIRNRQSLSKLSKEAVFVFDKTGTITKGLFTILSGLEKLSNQELQILKSMTQHSIHPISYALTNYIEQSSLSLDCIEEVAGKGIRSVFNNNHYFLGSLAWLKENGLHAESENNSTQVYFWKGNQLLAKIILGDELRKEAKKVVESLKPAKTVLLSGDGKNAVMAIANQCGFNEWHAECTPLHKREVIEELKKKHRVVCMVGDGINDAPALTAADIAISMVNASDISIHVSDILLTTDKLNALLKIRTLAKKGQKIAFQNLFWAFFYNVIGIGIAVGGYLTPLYAAIAMTLSSLIVLFNAKRLVLKKA